MTLLRFYESAITSCWDHWRSVDSPDLNYFSLRLVQTMVGFPPGSLQRRPCLEILANLLLHHCLLPETTKNIVATKARIIMCAAKHLLIQLDYDNEYKPKKESSTMKR